MRLRMEQAVAQRQGRKIYAKPAQKLVVDNADKRLHRIGREELEID